MMNLKEMDKRFTDALSKITKEDIDEWLKNNPPEDVPFGWVSIEEHLPQCMALDFVEKGYSEYLVKNKYGHEFMTTVNDSLIWYYNVKAVGITHWWNPQKESL